MPKPEMVRAKNKGGHEITLTAANAKRRGLEVLDDKEARDPSGKPLPPKPRTSKGGRRKSPAPVTPTEPESPADEQKEG